MEEIGRGRLTLVLVAINSIALLCPLMKVKKLNSEKNKGSPTLKMGKIWWIGVVTLHDYASKLKPCLCPNIGCSSNHLSSVRMVLDKVQTSSSGNRSFRSGEAGGGGSEEGGGGLWDAANHSGFKLNLCPPPLSPSTHYSREIKKIILLKKERKWRKLRFCPKNSKFLEFVKGEGTKCLKWNLAPKKSRLGRQLHVILNTQFTNVPEIQLNSNDLDTSFF